MVGMKMLKHLTHISLDEDIDSDVVVATVISVFLAGNPVDFLLPFTAAAATELLDRRGSLQEKKVVPEKKEGVSNGAAAPPGSQEGENPVSRSFFHKYIFPGPLHNFKCRYLW